MILDKDQKAVFVRWLETQISTSKGIEEQLKLINAPAAICTREAMTQGACKYVLRMIQSGEEVSIAAPKENAE